MKNKYKVLLLLALASAILNALYMYFLKMEDVKADD